MNKIRPLIGITTGYDYDKKNMYLKDGYYNAINKCGGVALGIPPTIDESILSDIFNRCDGILLSGGADIDAKHYGEPNLQYNGEISPIRDFTEIFLAKKAMEHNKALFGICRGIQVMNVAMGGTLYQDINMQVKDRITIAHSQKAPKWYPTHEIYIEKDSWVWKSLMKEQIGVNSFHHQAIKDIAPGFQVTSMSEDNIIESIEHVSHKFSVGVQWHPELMWQTDNQFINIFSNFISQANSN